MIATVLLLFAIPLLHSTTAQGSEPVFVQRGKDLHLDIKRSVNLNEKTDLFWKFNTKNNVGKINYHKVAVLYGNYEGRAELSTQSYSLLLKNVQHSDSGNYTAVVVGEQDQNVAEYKVIVQDPVSPVELTVDSVSSSSDSCNLTVTCSTVDSHISKTFRCDAQNCSQVEEKSLKPTNSFLIVYVQQDFIICNHRNQVSWKQSKKEIKPSCETKSVLNAATITAISASAVLCFIFTVLIVRCTVTRCKREKTENTIYEVPQDILPDQTQNQTPSGDTSCTSPTSTYALVEFHTRPVSTENKTTSLPETVYAQVDRSAKSKSTTPQQTTRAEEHQ